MPKWNEKILFVDDDENILQSYTRKLRSVAHVYTALGGEEGLKKIEEDGPFAVVISDMRMPNMDGAEFLSQVKDVSPNTVRIILTGQADIESAIKAVNDGRIFRFLSKPCPSQDMAEALVSSIKQYRLLASEADLLEKTLKGSIKVLTEVLSIVNPGIFGQTSRFRSLVNHLVSSLELDYSWDVEVAAMLSCLGYITLTDDLIKKISANELLSTEETQHVDDSSEICVQLIESIPRMEDVTKIIRAQKEEFILKKRVSDLDGEERLHLCGHVLKVAHFVDRTLVNGVTLESVLQDMRKKKNEFDIAVYGHLKTYEIATEENSFMELEISKLKPGMVLVDSVFRSDGTLLLSEGYILNPAAILHLTHHSKQSLIGSNVLVKN